MRLLQRSFSTLSILSLLALPASAQVVLYEVQGSPGDAFGFATLVVDDLNGDGFDEWLAGAPQGDGAIAGSGYVDVRSGVDGSFIARLDGPSGGAEFGSSLAWIHDYDQDGTRDVLIGAPGAGSAQVVSLSSFLPLLTLSGSVPFGTSVAALGDVDQDGTPDLGVGAPSFSTPDLVLFSGSNGAQIRTHSAAALLGASLISLGDVDADGVPDYAAGDRFHQSNVGLVRAFSGATGAVLWSTTGFDTGGDPFCTRLGVGLLCVPDRNADGVRDVLAGGDGFACFVGMPGRVAVLSGVDGSVLHETTRPSDTRFGFALALAGDVDLDGTEDFVCGEPAFQRPSSALVLSGADATTVLGSLAGPTSSTIQPFGHSVAGDAHFDADPFPDLLVGAPEQTVGGNDAGRVLAWSLGCPPTAQPYCPASPHSSGFANLEQSGTTSFSSGDFELSVSSAPGGRTGLFFVGTTAVNVPFGDGRRCAGGAILRLHPALQTTPVGRASRVTPPASLPAAAPFETRYFQFWFRDPMGPGGTGFNLTNGLRVTFCK